VHRAGAEAYECHSHTTELDLYIVCGTSNSHSIKSMSHTRTIYMDTAKVSAVPVSVAPFLHLWLRAVYSLILHVSKSYT